MRWRFFTKNLRCQGKLQDNQTKDNNDHDWLIEQRFNVPLDTL